MSLKYVHPSGSTKSGLVIIGEAPGEQEDLKGKPFVGRSGKLLDKMLQYIDLNREDVYITNIVKVRPPENRTPTPEEIESWRPVLLKELAEIKPKLIVTLGASATKALVSGTYTISEIRGKLVRELPFPDNHEIAFDILPTYHPSFLLRKAGDKRIQSLVKNDLGAIKEYLKST